MESDKLIFAIGNPLLDIASQPYGSGIEGFTHEAGQELMEKYSLVKALACLAEDKHKELFDQLWADEKGDRTPGGAAMNAIRCANFMLKEKDNSCLYFGSIADDERGQVLKNSLDAEKIDYNFSITDETYTGACAVVIVDNERSLCADLAACLKYKTSHLEENLDLIKQYKIIYTTGFFITSNAEALQKVAETAHENNILFSFNLSATFLISGCKDTYLAILPYVDLVFGNEDEIDVFGETHEVGSKDRKEIAAYIAKMDKKNTARERKVIITQGPDDTIVAVHNFETNETTVTCHPVPALAKEDIVDTNSAGDSFTGGYLAALAQGHSEETCLEAARYCAKYILKTPGCQFLRENEFQYPALE
ncbi:unnamed protein product [Moneuplotes crassus]|uniref:Adenosine kinase n=1 Tax=Euplotes crassus TaxID=5936 RepID=A0AAD1XJD4_EUPCR|nr:unnamed protein product [Moneuplotes crassus]